MKTFKNNTTHDAAKLLKMFLYPGHQYFNLLNNDDKIRLISAWFYNLTVAYIIEKEPLYLLKLIQAIIKKDKKQMLENGMMYSLIWVLKKHKDFIRNQMIDIQGIHKRLAITTLKQVLHTLHNHPERKSELPKNLHKLADYYYKAIIKPLEDDSHFQLISLFGKLNYTSNSHEFAIMFLMSCLQMVTIAKADFAKEKQKNLSRQKILQLKKAIDHHIKKSNNPYQIKLLTPILNQYINARWETSKAMHLTTLIEYLSKIVTLFFASKRENSDVAILSFLKSFTDFSTQYEKLYSKLYQMQVSARKINQFKLFIESQNDSEQTDTSEAENCNPENDILQTLSKL